MIEMIAAAAAGVELVRGGTTLIDRVLKAKQAGLDERAIKRLAVLEARRNARIVEVALKLKSPLPASQMWVAAQQLETSALETLLGTGKESGGALAIFDKIKPAETSPTTGVNLAENLYVSIEALKALARVDKHEKLDKVRIGVRLDNIYADLVAFIRAGAPTKTASR